MRHLMSFWQTNEAVGIPEGILDIAAEIVQATIDLCNEGDFDISSEETSEYRYPAVERVIELPSIPIFGKINDFDVKRVEMSIHVLEIESEKSGRDIRGAFYSPNPEPDFGKFEVSYKSDGVIAMGLNIEIPWSGFGDEDTGDALRGITSEVIGTIDSNRDKIESNLAHELMHSYDLGHVKGGETMQSRARYSATDLRTGVDPIDSFIFDLYFMCAVEMAVRVVEVGAGARKVQKKDFVAFLEENDAYKRLKEVSEWTYDGMKAKILSDIDEIKEKLGYDGDLGDEELVEDLLKRTLGVLASSSLDSLKGVLGSRIMEISFGELIGRDVSAEKKALTDLLDSFREELSKEMADEDGEINPDKYFRAKEKKFHRDADKLIRKIHKLYDTAKDDEVNPLQAKISAKKPAVREGLKRWDDFRF
jgi:hypothetical protein